jgi:hypothetical protein
VSGSKDVALNSAYGEVRDPQERLLLRRIVRTAK